MNSFVVASTRENTSGVLIDDEHLTVHHHVIFISLEECFRLDGVVQERNQRCIGRLIQVVNAEVILDLFDTGLENSDRSLLEIYFIVLIEVQFLGNSSEFTKPAVRLARGGSRNNQRSSGLINQD